MWTLRSELRWESDSLHGADDNVLQEDGLSRGVDVVQDHLPWAMSLGTVSHALGGHESESTYPFEMGDNLVPPL